MSIYILYFFENIGKYNIKQKDTFEFLDMWKNEKLQRKLVSQLEFPVLTN